MSQEKDMTLMDVERHALDYLVDYLAGDIQDYTAEDEDGDVIHEVADNCVPVHNYDLLTVAASCLDMAVNEPECGPAFDGKATPINIIAANIYDHLSSFLYENWGECYEKAVELAEKKVKAAK